MLVDIAEINLNSPYHVSFDETADSLVFHTDHGVEYKISFIKDIETFHDLVVHHFMLHPSNRSRYGHHLDIKIRETVFYILRNFLLHDDKVVVYICDNIDSQAEYRNRLFNQWFKKADDIFDKQFELHDVSYTNYDVSFYGGIIFRTGHPQANEYLEAFNQAKDTIDEK